MFTGCYVASMHKCRTKISGIMCCRCDICKIIFQQAGVFIAHTNYNINRIKFTLIVLPKGISASVLAINLPGVNRAQLYTQRTV